MEKKEKQIPDCPGKAWAEIYRVAKKGNDAIVKIRNGEVQVIEVHRKLTVRENIS